MLWGALVLAGLAGGILGVALFPPFSPWYVTETQPLVQGLAAAWCLWRLLALDRALAHRRAWTTTPTWAVASPALPALPLPWWCPCWLASWWDMRHPGVFLGQAFRWEPQHAHALDRAVLTEGALPIATDARGGHPALHAVGQSQEEPLVLPWSELPGQTMLTGSTRSGKTRLLEVMACEVIRASGAVVVFDPKGDRDFLARCAAEAHRHGKPFALITPAFPAQSASLNVLDTAQTPAEVSARIRSLMPSAGGRPNEPFFEEFPLALIERLASAQAALGVPWTLEALYKPAVFAHHADKLLADYLSHLGMHTTGKLSALIGEYRKAGLDDLVADALIEDHERQREHFQKITSNLIPAFRGVVGPPLGPLFSTLPADVTWSRIVEEDMVVYVALASMLLGDIANRIGRVLLQDLIGFLGRRYAYDDPATLSPITILIDEVADVLYPGFVTALNKGGGANARFVLAQQSFADPEAVLGPVGARRLFDNCNTRVVFRLADAQTADEVSQGYGTCVLPRPERGVGLSFGGVGGLSGTTQHRVTQPEGPLVQPQWLVALPRGHAFVRTKGELWKLRVPLLDPVSEGERDALGLTALWQGLAPGSGP